MTTADNDDIPIILLKTKSTPTDTYADYFSQFRIVRPDNNSSSSSSNGDITFDPINLAVLEHTFNEENIREVESLLVNGAFDDVHEEEAKEDDDDRTGEERRPRRHYGGIIFTSQRAVEAFVDIVQRVAAVTEAAGKDRIQRIPPRSHRASSVSHMVVIPDKLIKRNWRDAPQRQPQSRIRLSAKTAFYVVGPATHRALLSSPFIPPSSVYGHDSGNGDRLAQFILRHYNSIYPNTITPTGNNNNNNNNKREKPPLLFLAGETRRDIIPRTLMRDPSLSADQRIHVEELVVYETRLLPSFADDLRATLDRLLLFGNEKPPTAAAAAAAAAPIWIVVFSPTGCRELLTVVGILDDDDEEKEETGREKKREWSSKDQVKIASIGPTTQSYLLDELGFRPHVCAEKPTPESVAEAIRGWMVGMMKR